MRRSEIHRKRDQTVNLHCCGRLVALPGNIGSLKDFRELNLKCCENLEVLPKEVGALTRLRCLDLSDTMIKVLPESCISNLCSLEIIDFGNKCAIPKEIKSWPKLRFLKYFGRKRNEMPRGIETLTCLESLIFYVEKNRDTISSSGGGSGIEKLANLNSLQVLKILNLEFVRDGIDAKKAKLKDKMNLHGLCLDWQSTYKDDDGEMVYDDDSDDEMTLDEVLEGLEPHINLREFKIHDFPGLKLPKWMGLYNCLPNLVKLELSVCYRCEKLPALGILPCLKVLLIDSMNSVKSLGEEFYYEHEEKEERIGSSSSNSSTKNAPEISLFPSLIHLKIQHMPRLEEWVALFQFIVHSLPLKSYKSSIAQI
ncbi:putative disease resistance protein RGA1 isoform X2 [Papaver somniferum]|uniref:putative disease resistance protein RGA1 isoform X2 n=1 Tax=Papaver somniferum TaxID=3469 RepID=UPI000E704DA0|nr:putative disease resistance protein RGA1 isoform X2 [Papaver somniferum]